MKCLAILFLLTALPGNVALACSPPPPDPQRDAREADSIQIGYVVGERWPDYETRLMGAPPGRNRRLVRVVFTESLKGNLSAPREVSVACSAPFPNVRERVFVAHHAEGDYLVPADFPGYEQGLRKEIASGL